MFLDLVLVLYILKKLVLVVLGFTGVCRLSLVAASLRLLFLYGARLLHSRVASLVAKHSSRCTGFW